MSVVPAAAMFLQRKNSRPEVYTDVHFWTGYFQKANGKPYFTVCAATENPQRIISSKNNTEIIGSQYYFQKLISVTLSRYTLTSLLLLLW